MYRRLPWKEIHWVLKQLKLSLQLFQNDLNLRYSYLLILIVVLGTKLWYFISSNWVAYIQYMICLLLSQINTFLTYAFLHVSAHISGESSNFLQDLVSNAKKCNFNVMDFSISHFSMTSLSAHYRITQ